MISKNFKISSFSIATIASGLTILMLNCCGSSSKSTTTTPAPTTTLSFSTDIAPIIKTSCSASGCHGVTGAGSKIYENNEATFKAQKADAIRRMGLKSSEADFMPRSPSTISSADKDKIINYLNQ